MARELKNMKASMPEGIVQILNEFDMCIEAKRPGKLYVTENQFNRIRYAVQKRVNLLDNEGFTYDGLELCVV